MALKGTNQEFGRPYNRRIVLESVRLHSPTTRTEIAARVGLTVQTVSTIVRELEEQNYITSFREEPKGRGLPPSMLRINPHGGFAIGVHVTPISVEAALIDLSGNVVHSLGRAITGAAPEEAFGTIGAMVTKLVGLRPDGRMLGIGMAMPGPFGVESMSFIGPTTMAGWKNVAIQERLAEMTGLPAFLETDTAAAALGEHLYGLGRRFSEYYYLYLGVGLGGALVHEGDVLRGASGNAGEIGHIPIVPDGEPCPCGNRGCMERYFSLEAFRRTGMSEESWLQAVAPVFRNAVITIENLFDPETVVLGGLASTEMLARIVEMAAKLPNSVAARLRRKTPRVIAAQGGEHAVLRGAAALAVSGVLSPRFGQMFTDDGKRDTPHGREVAA